VLIAIYDFLKHIRLGSSSFRHRQGDVVFQFIVFSVNSGSGSTLLLQAADVCPGAVTWRTRRSNNVVLDFGPLFDIVWL